MNTHTTNYLPYIPEYIPSDIFAFYRINPEDFKLRVRLNHYSLREQLLYWNKYNDCLEVKIF